MLNDNFIDWQSLEIDGVDIRDYPDFCDAYVCYGLDINGSPLTDAALDYINDKHSDIVYDLAMGSIF